ncbi:hypothetical protein GIB67_015932 [Kingdonia uniflora]|uniref:Uncharacterized protein n=1 Tax=Kingdonia uniflora TaxID=39325 RepID=A0A7J7PC88_9MAGN|nr:hypothetical protein GIB67_015932 [Kingdonia uniflora]
MKSDREVNEQFEKVNQTQESGAKKGTFNTKNYTSWYTGLEIHKMFAALPEEEKGTLRTTCFTPLLLIDPIATMSMLVVEIFDRHLGDMKFQFGETIIQMKPIHVCLILKLRVSPIANKNHIEAPTIGTAPTIEPPAVGAPTIGSSSSATEIKVVVVRVCSQLEEHRKMLLKLDDHGKMLHNHGKMLKRILMSTVGGSTLPLGDTLLLGQYQFSTPEKTTKHKREGENLLQQVTIREGLEVVKDLVVDDDVEVGMEVNCKAILSEYGGDLLEASSDQTTTVSVKEQTIEVEKTEDEAKVAQTEVVIYHQEEDVDEASQSKKSKENVKQNKKEVVEGKDDDDGNLQNKPDPEQLILMKSEVDVTLKKRHPLTEDKINEKTFKMACRINQLHAHLDELLSGVLLKSFIQRPISQDEKK